MTIILLVIIFVVGFVCGKAWEFKHPRQCHQIQLPASPQNIRMVEEGIQLDEEVKMLELVLLYSSAGYCSKEEATHNID